MVGVNLVIFLNQFVLFKSHTVRLTSPPVSVCSELKQFKDNNGSSPRYTINMCFGEKFPDGKALEKKLIVVKVKHSFPFLFFRASPQRHMQCLFIFLQHFQLCNSNICLFAPVGDPTDLSTVPRDGPNGGSFIASQLQRQPADVAQQPL